jgi:predicted HTH domain antitoxin
VTILTIEFPDGLETAVSMTKQEFAAEVRLMAALKMFELGKLSSGKAAQLAGISRVEFFELCGRYQVSIMNYSGNEIGFFGNTRGTPICGGDVEWKSFSKTE